MAQAGGAEQKAQEEAAGSAEPAELPMPELAGASAKVSAESKWHHRPEASSERERGIIMAVSQRAMAVSQRAMAVSQRAMANSDSTTKIEVQKRKKLIKFDIFT